MAPPKKRGLAWPVDNHTTDPVFPFTKPGSKVGWLYNWSPDPTPNSASLEFVPMAWNHVGLSQLSQKLHQNNSTIVLAFNEPELSSQANMTPEQAAQEWLTHIAPLRNRNSRNAIRAGSPGISSAPEGVSWLQKFLELIRAGGSDVDFLCLHWYGETLGQFYDYIWSTHHRLDPSKPVWITEYACTNWNAEAPLPTKGTEDFARESATYLDSLDWVERYAWFGAMRDPGTVGRGAAMIEKGSGALTKLGREYRDG